eukprot:scaffold3831_cov112-Isochrysis_galbana.AAC.5
MRAHHRYDYAPARYPVARPEPAQRTAGALCLSTARAPAVGMESDLPIDHTIRLPTTIRTLPHIVLPISDPFLPTAAVLAGEGH